MALLVDTTIKLDWQQILWTSLLPWITEAQPVVSLLHLFAVAYALRKQPILVANTITIAGDSQAGHRVQETGGQATKAAVSEAGVLLFLFEFLNVEAKLVKRLVA